MIDDEKKSQKKKRESIGTWKGWMVCIFVTFAGIVAMMNQFKVPPVTRDLMEIFMIDSGTAGWLTSVFALTGLILAVPAAFILKALGPKGTGMVALGATILGVTVGATTDSFAVLLVSRVIEGTGVALMGVVGPSVISMYFNREKSGLPMGIWNIWYATGSFTAYNVAVPVAQFFGNGSLDWHAIWWFGDIMALLAFLLVALFVSRPKPGDVVGDPSRPMNKPMNAPEKVKLTDGFKVKRVWVLALGFCFLMLTSLSFQTWAPTYFREAFAMDPGTAGTMASMSYMWSIPASIVCGLLLNRFNTRKQRSVMLVMCAVVELAIYPWCFLIPQEFLHPYLILCGLATGFTAGCVWAAVPLTMPKKATIPVGMGLLQCFKSLANLLGTPIMGYIVQVGTTTAGTPLYNWTLGCIPISLFAIVSICCMVAYAKMKPDAFEEDQPQAAMDSKQASTGLKEVDVL